MKDLKAKIIAMAFSNSELLRRVREAGFSLTLYCKITLPNNSKMLETCLHSFFFYKNNFIRTRATYLTKS